MSDDIERELHFVAYPNQAVHRRSRFHLKITPVDFEFSLRPQVVSRNGHLCRNRNWPRHAMPSQFAPNLPIVLVIADAFPANIRALKTNVGIVVWQQHSVAQLFLDHLFCLSSKE